MERNSFIFYKSFYDAVRELPKDAQAEVLCAIIEYGLGGELSAELSPVAKCMLTLVRPTIDANNQHYLNGKRGGRPKKSQTIDSEYFAEKPNENQTETESKPNVNQTETDLQKTETEHIYIDVDVDKDVDVDNDVSVFQKKASPHTHKVFEFGDILWEFFKNNRKNPSAEAQRFWDYYSSQNWCKSNGAKLTNISSAVRMWKCQSEGVRFETNVQNFLTACLRDVPSAERELMIAGLVGAKVKDGAFILTCTQPMRDSIEANIDALLPIYRENLPNIELKYAITR